VCFLLLFLSMTANMLNLLLAYTAMITCVLLYGMLGTANSKPVIDFIADAVRKALQAK